jgi:hypothetical protein
MVKMCQNGLRKNQNQTIMISDFIKANQLFSERMIETSKIEVEVPIKFEISFIKNHCTVYALYIDLSYAKLQAFGIKTLPEYSKDYLIYGLHECEGYLLLPENHDAFVQMIEDKLDMSIHEITNGIMTYDYSEYYNMQYPSTNWKMF